MKMYNIIRKEKINLTFVLVTYFYVFFIIKRTVKIAL